MVDENWARFERERARQGREQAFRENAERAARDNQRIQQERTETARKQNLQWIREGAEQTRKQQKLSDDLSRQRLENRPNKQNNYPPIDTRYAGSSGHFGWLTILIGIAGFVYMLRNASQSTINIVIWCGIGFAIIMLAKWIITMHPKFVFLCAIIAGIWYYNTH